MDPVQDHLMMFHRGMRSSNDDRSGSQAPDHDGSGILSPNNHETETTHRRRAYSYYRVPSKCRPSLRCHIIRFYTVELPTPTTYTERPLSYIDGLFR